MALIRLDSFNFYSTGQIPQRWSTSAFAIIVGGGRFSGNTLRMDNSQYFFTLDALSPHATRALGVNIKISAGTAQFRFRDGATTQVRVNVGLTTIEAFRGDSTSLGTASVSLLANTWYYLEIETLINSSTGHVKVWIDNVLTLNLTSQNTQNTGSATSDSYHFTCTNNTSYDELYLTDGSGSNNVGRLGPKRVISLVLDGDGTTTDWDTSSGPTHYTLVDETGSRNDSDYVETDVVNEIDLYTAAAISGVSVAGIFGLQITLAALESGLTNREMQAVVRTNSLNFTSSSFVLISAVLYYMAIFEQNPDTLANWTEAEVNAAEFGAKLTV